MREVHAAVLSVILVALFPAAASADPGCGCVAPANRPCTEETLATASVPQTLALSSGNGADQLGAFVRWLLLLPIVLTLKRLTMRRPALIVARFDRMSQMHDARSEAPCNESPVEVNFTAPSLTRAAA